ncbi:MAG: Holliday junction branch migration protein RuvA [Eubacteriales bacterium]|nr:Holliday junction branch migration protein RuvA [Eubacteriales bacterium]
MYYYIKGEKVLTGDGFVVIDAGGVGYKIATSLSSISSLSDKSGVVTMYVQLIVREDSQELVGFTTNEELSMYKHLTSVSGVGPKAAIAILSTSTPAEVALAVMTDDVKTITRASGVGPKLAKRVILELRDKLKNEDILPSEISVADISAPLSDSLTEAAAALTVLGYSASDAKAAVSKLDANMSVEDLVREALKLLM